MTSRLSPALEWLERHGDVLYHFALRRVGRDRAAAEDLLQETLLAALQGHEQFESRSSERTWLVGILHHKIVDHRRRRAATRERATGHAPEDRDLDSYFFDARGRWRVPPARWDASTTDPHRLLERSEFRDVLRRCLAKLPARSADVFWQREAEGVQTSQLCEQFQVTRANVWAMLHRARLQLRQCLTLHWFAPDQPRSDRHEDHQV